MQHPILHQIGEHLAQSHGKAVHADGMNENGASATLEMRHAGLYTSAEDESTCVVLGSHRASEKNHLRFRVASHEWTPKNRGATQEEWRARAATPRVSRRRTCAAIEAGCRR